MSNRLLATVCTDSILIISAFSRRIRLWVASIGMNNHKYINWYASQQIGGFYFEQNENHCKTLLFHHQQFWHNFFDISCFFYFHCNLRLIYLFSFKPKSTVFFQSFLLWFTFFLVCIVCWLMPLSHILLMKFSLNSKNYIVFVLFLFSALFNWHENVRA